MNLLLVLLLALSQDGPLRNARDRALPRLTPEAEGEWKGPFFFIQLADPQFGFMKDADREVGNAERAVEHVNRLRPRFVVVCGDLTHPEPGKKGYEEQRAKYLRIFGRVDASIPVISVAGNHDVGKSSAPADVETYAAAFGDDYFSFWSGGLQGLVLNSSLYGAADSEARKRQDEWFTARLAEARKDPPRHLVVFQHHSWFLSDPGEKDGYFNIPLERRGPALEAMKRSGVRTVFAGHYHGNAHGRDGDLEMVTSGPVGRPLRKDPSGLRIVKVYADRLEHAYHPLDAVPDAVRLE